MSEVTRAEQLADWLDGLDLRAPEKIMQAVTAAAELRRLSAVEASVDELLAEHADFVRYSRNKFVRQTELLQQAKEAMAEAKNWMSWAKTELDKDIPTGEPVHPVSVKLTWPASSLALTLSAITEWEKSQ